MAEYKLSYSAKEIDEKLGKVDSLVASVNGVKPDVNGNVAIASGGGNGIIDVTELPIENINEGAFYRLMTAKFVSNYYSAVDGWTCYCVDGLPSTGEPVSTDMINITGYYNMQDNEVYGYADSMISAAGGVPVGWYPIGVLGQAFDIAWGGVITDADDIDESAKVLLSYDFYIYQNGWTKTIFAYEHAPAFEITWDGVIGDRFALDLSPLGYEGIQFVKVSDDVFTESDVIGATYYQVEGYTHTIESYDIDSTTFPGALSIDGGIVVAYSADDTNAVLGLPSGYITNGTYFVYDTKNESVNYTYRLVASAKIAKIPSKYLDVADVDISSLGLHYVATSGNYYDLINRPDIYTDVVRYNTTQNLGTSSKQRARNNIDVYSKSEVDNKISDAIGSAIGGSY